MSFVKIVLHKAYFSTKISSHVRDISDLLQTGVGAADRLLLHGGTGARAVGRVRALIRRALEKIMLQRVVRGDARLGVVVEHAQNQVLELEIVRERVAGLALPSTPRSPGLHSQYVVQFA